MPIRTLKRALFLLVLPLSLACGSDSSSTPDSGSTSIDSGLPSSAEVTIKRDSYGIPYISANTDFGAMFSLGYASAQDRLLYMNLMALGIQGRT
ncbi:MAG: penicillin acylase family protein [Kofleriaceae bacterium]|nr:penicillin acylase family protein [Kofleriaceae bacterium]